MAVMHSIAMRPRFYTAALVGAVALLVLPRSWPTMIRASAALISEASRTSFFAFRLVLTCGATRIKARAARRDDSRLVILTLILLAITASFAAIAGLIVEAKLPTTEPPEKLLLAGLAIVTLMISWTVTQVAFALHYAHDYYRPDPGSDAGYGLVFRDARSPTIGISSIFRHPSARPPRRPTPRSNPALCGGLSRCTQLLLFSSTQQFWR